MVIELSSNDKVNSFFDGLIKSRFIEIFGDPICNDKNWNVFSLDTYCTITTGNTPSRSKKEYYGGDLEWIKSDNITSESIVTSAAECLSKDGEEVARVVGPNSILMVCIAGSLQRIGDVALTDRRVSFNQQINAIYSDSYNPRFLLELFKITKPILQQEIGMALKGMLSKSKLSSLEYIFPPIELQNQFADFVRQVDRTKSIFQQMVSRFDELVKSRFIEMFGSVQSNVYKWEIKTIDELSQVPLSYGSQASAIDYDGHIRYVRITDISDGGTLNDDVKSPSIVDKKYFLDEGDILFARSGATAGKTYIYHEKDGQCIYAGYLIRMKPDSSIIDPDFMYHFTSTADYISFVEESRRGAAQPNINAKQYGSVEVIVPPLDLQKKFVSFVRQVDKSKSNLLCYVNTLLNNGD